MWSWFSMRRTLTDSCLERILSVCRDVKQHTRYLIKTEVEQLDGAGVFWPAAKKRTPLNSWTGVHEHQYSWVIERSVQHLT